MIISEVQHTIDALDKALPESFIFVFDTTDRSFIYKSIDRQDCVKKIIAFDQKNGIDKLTSNLDFYTYKEGNTILILRKLAPHSFLGVCALHAEIDLQLLDIAKSILMN